MKFKVLYNVNGDIESTEIDADQVQAGPAGAGFYNNMTGGGPLQQVAWIPVSSLVAVLPVIDNNAPLQDMLPLSEDTAEPPLRVVHPWHRSHGTVYAGEQPVASFDKYLGVRATIDREVTHTLDGLIAAHNSDPAGPWTADEECLFITRGNASELLDGHTMLQRLGYPDYRQEVGAALRELVTAHNG